MQQNDLYDDGEGGLCGLLDAMQDWPWPLWLAGWGVIIAAACLVAGYCAGLGWRLAA